jgi:hypothetical protein
MQHAMGSCREVCATQRDIHKYAVYDGQITMYQFPQPELVIRLTHEQCSYAVLSHLCLPTPAMLDDRDIKHEEKARWERMHGGVEKTLSASEQRLLASDETFINVHGKSSFRGHAISAEDLARDLGDERTKIRNENNLARIAEKNTTDPIKRAKLKSERLKRIQAKYDEFYNVAFSRFREVWNDLADISPAIRAGIKWIDDYVAKHGTMYRPVQRFSTNLSTMQELLVMYMQEQSISMANAVTHINCLRIWIAINDAQSPRRKDHFHYLALGDPATGKSHSIDECVEQSVPGVIETLSYTTLRADTQGNFDHTSRVQHELSASRMELGPSGRTAPTPEAQQDKDAMTRGEFSYSEVFFDQFKQRVNRSKRIKCARTNISSSNFIPSKAMISRYFPDWFERIAIEGKNIPSIMCAIRDHGWEESRKHAIEGRRWEHAMQILLGQLIECGVLEDACIDVTKTLLPKVLERARKDKLNRADTNQRATTRLHAAARFFVKWRAIYLTFRSELSPYRGERNPDGTYKGKAWNVTQMRTCQYHLVDSDPKIFSSALGVLRPDFEEADESIVLRAIFKCDIDSSEENKDDGMDGLLSSVSSMSNSSSMSNGSSNHNAESKSPLANQSAPTVEIEGEYHKVTRLCPVHMNDASKIEWLGKRWMSAMFPRPSKAVIENRIHELLTTFWSISNFEYPVLDFVPGGYRILKSAKNSCEFNRLERATMHVMSRVQTDEEDIHLFGNDVVRLDMSDLKMIKTKKVVENITFSNPLYSNPKRREIVRANFAGFPSRNAMYQHSMDMPAERKMSRSCALHDNVFYKFQDELGATPERLVELNVFPESVLCRKLIAASRQEMRAWKTRLDEAKLECKDDATYEHDILEKTGAMPVELQEFNPELLCKMVPPVDDGHAADDAMLVYSTVLDPPQPKNTTGSNKRKHA